MNTKHYKELLEKTIKKLYKSNAEIVELTIKFQSDLSKKIESRENVKNLITRLKTISKFDNPNCIQHNSNLKHLLGILDVKHLPKTPKLKNVFDLSDIDCSELCDSSDSEDLDNPK